MEERNVYQDISRRTDGDVYIGVVGPVRTGKSTFIKRFRIRLSCPISVTRQFTGVPLTASSVCGRKNHNDHRTQIYSRGIR